MKKLIVAALLSLSLSIGTTNTVFAKDNTTNQQTIVVSASDKNDSNKYRVYKLSNKKMVATKKNVSISNKKGIIHWKASKTKVNGKTWWRIGKNQYLKSTRVEIIDVAKMKQINQKISNYAN